MKQITYFCDKCKKMVSKEQRHEVSAYDFCEDCFTLLCGEISQWIQSEKEKEHAKEEH